MRRSLAVMTTVSEKYPGFPGITGNTTLAMNMSAGRQFGVRQDYGGHSAAHQGQVKLLDTKAGTLRARSVILARRRAAPSRPAE
ncbi:MAG: hypothetical protein ACLS69_04795 [Butyricicoccus sp.]